MIDEISNLELKAFLKRRIIYKLENDFYKENPNDLDNDFLHALLMCENENEILELNTLLLNISQIYNLNMEEWIQARINAKCFDILKKHVAEDNEKRYGPGKSSYKTPDGKTLFSEYFIFYYPDNRKLEELCHKLIYKLIGVDISRTKEKYAIFMESFYECLNACENNKDLQQFDEFFKILSKQGPVAKAFYDRLSKEIKLTSDNPYKGSNEAYRENQIGNQIIDKFNEQYEYVLNMQKYFEEKKLTGENDFNEMINLFQALYDKLIETSPYIDSSTFNMLKNEIEKYIAYYQEAREEFTLI